MKMFDFGIQARKQFLAAQNSVKHCDRYVVVACVLCAICAVVILCSQDEPLRTTGTAIATVRN